MEDVVKAMTSARIAQLLIEKASNVDPRVGTEMNRALLRIYTQPSLNAFLGDSGIVVKEDGTQALQFVFYRLPQEVISQVERLLCVDAFKSYHWSQFILNGQAVMGLEIVVDTDDLPDGLLDYAL